MKNFEKPTSPLSIVPDQLEMELKAVQDERDRIADELTDLETKRRKLQGTLSAVISEGLDTSMAETRARLSEILDKEKVLKDALKNNLPLQKPATEVVVDWSQRVDGDNGDGTRFRAVS